eukprot:SAG22_NODE_1842_length_3456_cov_3.666369_6_plen_272_part_00
MPPVCHRPPVHPGNKIGIKLKVSPYYSDSKAVWTPPVRCLSSGISCPGFPKLDTSSPRVLLPDRCPVWAIIPTGNQTAQVTKSEEENKALEEAGEAEKAALEAEAKKKNAKSLGKKKKKRRRPAGGGGGNSKLSRKERAVEKKLQKEEEANEQAQFVVETLSVLPRCVARDSPDDPVKTPGHQLAPPVPCVRPNSLSHHITSHHITSHHITSHSHHIHIITQGAAGRELTVAARDPGLQGAGRAAHGPAADAGAARDQASPFGTSAPVPAI